jgi:hypothetical protein
VVVYVFGAAASLILLVHLLGAAIFGLLLIDRVKLKLRNTEGLGDRLVAILPLQDLYLSLKNCLQIPAHPDSEYLILEDMQHLDVLWPVLKAGEKDHDLSSGIRVYEQLDCRSLLDGTERWHD